MATVYKTPGVYIEEIAKFPPSIAQVETAIPAFIGYTEKAEKNGEPLFNKPLRISSLLEFTEYFGGPYVPAAISVTLDESNNNAVTAVTIADGERYFLYDSIRLFYDNGGGDCYIVSVAKYKQTNPAIALGSAVTPLAPGFLQGLAAIEKEDEPTLLLFPDATLLPTAASDQFYSLQQQALAQCAKLQDRFVIMDLYERNSHTDADKNFRNKIGINDLKYGAAYTPWLYTTYDKTVNFKQFMGNISNSGGPVANLMTLSTDTSVNDLISVTQSAITDVDMVKNKINAVADTPNSGAGAGVIPRNPADPLVAPTIYDNYKEFVKNLRNAADDTAAQARLADLLTFVRNIGLYAQTFKTDLKATNVLNDVNAYATSKTMWRGAMDSLIKLEKNNSLQTLSGMPNDAAAEAFYTTSGLALTSPAQTITIDAAWLGETVANTNPPAVNPPDYTNGGAVTGKNLALAVEPVIKSIVDMLVTYYEAIYSSAQTYLNIAQQNLYDRHPVIGNIVKYIKKELSRIPPSGAVAGICARVDSQRGVWKAPANESIRSVVGPVTQITHEKQASYNVDAVAGKSINVIRSFVGRGTIVWGGRTLAGNDNEWRYVNVRRFFNMVEESSKNATMQFVFEPNDANTWVKVQGMIENFLITLWRQGALQGAKPEHAFYVAVGLGKTMTALDILEGRMIVEIGMAVVRPAEFIILRFSHKMAES